MIDMIGQKKIALCGAILALNIIFAVLSSVVFDPQQSGDERKLRTLRAEVNRYQRELNSAADDFDQLGGQQQIFTMLEEKQFFDPSLARKQTAAIEALSEKYGVQAQFKVLENRTVPLSGLQQIQRSLFRAAVDIDVDAMDDVDIYNYIQGLGDNLPGYIQVRSLNIERTQNYSGNILRDIMQGKFVSLVKAHYRIYWYFMSGPPTEEGGDRDE